MLSLLRPARSCLRTQPRGTWNGLSRTITSSSARNALETTTPKAQEDQLTLSETQGEVSCYREFMEKIGAQYEYASPAKWLGGSVPFPMNPSFKPPPPISDRQKTAMWKQWAAAPSKGTMRMMSMRYNLSQKRVAAILRLKSMEAAWQKGKTLQTGFQVGMERLLKAQTHNAVDRIERYHRWLTPVGLPISEGRSDVNQADLLEAEEDRDNNVHGYERMYWESIDESKMEPSLPMMLQNAKARAEYKALVNRKEQNKKIMQTVRETAFVKRPASRILTLRRPSRPTTQFVDVGGQFLDVEAHLQRLAVAKRKAAAEKAEKRARQSSN